MKKLLILVAVLVVGLLAYNFATTGEVKLIPSFGLSDEEQAVKDLEDRFDAAKSEFAQAHRAAGVSGVDTSSGAEAARRSAQSIQQELASLRKNLSSDDAVDRAAGLATAVDRFLDEMR